MARKWSPQHTEVALWGCAVIVAGEVLGLIVGGIREVWLWRTSESSKSPELSVP